ncbi:MAG: hypothetical protein FWD58_05845 [Firmicutes bacterium]|nr:hypothetical protein [Bacillota bacterium]
MRKTENLVYDNLIKSFCTFLIDNDYETLIEKETSELVSALKNLHCIGTSLGLMGCIRSDKDSLKNILILLDISEEKFKRIVSMLRQEMGYKFSTE